MSVCVDEVSAWIASNRLQLNHAKTEVLWCSLLSDGDCTAQYNSSLPATRLLTVGASVFFVLFNFVRCPCNVFDMIVSPYLLINKLLLTYLLTSYMPIFYRFRELQLCKKFIATHHHCRSAAGMTCCCMYTQSAGVWWQLVGLRLK